MAPLLAPLRGDVRTFERMYRRHVHDVYGYALAMLRNPADAEDVTQTTFMNAYRAFERGERPRQPHNWLISIAHNVCRQRFRNASRRAREVEWDESVAAVVPDDDPGPTVADVQRALSYLPFNQRSALVMRELEGRSYAEIAEILDLSVSAVETLLFRARRALREQLADAITCGDAELAISRQLDGRLPRDERGALRAHLRACSDCARHARRLRAQRAALKGLGVVPLPASLVSWAGGGTAAGGTAAGVGLGVGAKAAAVVAAGAVAVGGGTVVAGDVEREPPRRAEAAAAIASGPAPPPRAVDAVRRAAAPRATAAAPSGPAPSADRRAKRVRPKTQRAANATPVARGARKHARQPRPARQGPPKLRRDARPARVERVLPVRTRTTPQARPKRPARAAAPPARVRRDRGQAAERRTKTVAELAAAAAVRQRAWPGRKRRDVRIP